MPFQDFIAAVIAAQYRDFQHDPATRVTNESDFEEMRQYILRFYAGAVVNQSIVVGDQVFDCIVSPGNEVASQEPTGGCPDNTVPTRRLTLEGLTRFPTLSAFLSKAPDSP